MRSNKLQIKFYIEQNGTALELEPFVPVFHDWIKRDALGELLIDVVDYAHVHRGPGVVLIGHGSDYFIDAADGRPGLLYTRKREAPSDPAERLQDAFKRALTACRLLEQEPALAGHIRFSTAEVVVRVLDRLTTSNDDASFVALKRELEPVLTKLYAGSKVEFERAGSSKELLTARVRASSSPDLETLVGRAAAA